MYLFVVYIVVPVFPVCSYRRELLYEGFLCTSSVDNYAYVSFIMTKLLKLVLYCYLNIWLNVVIS